MSSASTRPKSPIGGGRSKGAHDDPGLVRKLTKHRREDLIRRRAAQKDPTLRVSEIDHHLAKVRRHNEIVPDMARLSIRTSLRCPRISKQNPLRRRAR